MPMRRDLRRHSLRLAGRDYTAAGHYLMTFIVAGRQPLFGEVDADGVDLSAAGQMVEKSWLQIPDEFPSVALDEYIVMPDHLHGIVYLVEARDDDGPSLGSISTWFKSTTVELYRLPARMGLWPPYEGKLWQKDFHDRVLRAGELDVRRAYIRDNPKRRWEQIEAERIAPPAIWGSPLIERDEM